MPKTPTFNSDIGELMITGQLGEFPIPEYIRRTLDSQARPIAWFARHCGLSPKTVSKIVHRDYSGYRRLTLQKILQGIEVIELSSNSGQDEVSLIETTTEVSSEDINELLWSLPRQKLGANVSIIGGKIARATLPLDQNNEMFDIISVLHSQVLEKCHHAHSQIKSTDNQFPRLGVDIEKYLGMIDCSIGEVDFTLTFLIGLDIKTEVEAIIATLETDRLDEYNPLSLEKRSSVNKLIAAHSAFIGMSDEGSMLLDAAARASRTPERERIYRENLINFGEGLKEHENLIDSDLADTVIEYASAPMDDVNGVAKRSTANRYVRNILVLTGTVVAISSPAALAGLGLAVVFGAPIGAVGAASVGTITGLVVRDAYRDSKAHKELKYGLTTSMDRFTEGEPKFLDRIKNFISLAWELIVPVSNENALDEWFHEIHRQTDEFYAHDYNPILLARVDQMQWKPETVATLRYNDIEFVGDLIQLNDRNVLNLVGIERVDYNNIRMNLARVGLHLNMNMEGIWPPKNLVTDKARFENRIQMELDKNISIDD